MVALLIIGLLLLSYYFGLSMLYAKAGEQRWKAFIPFYNSITTLKIIGKEWYWIFILLIPGINIIYFIFGILFELYRSFGKESLFDQIIGTLFFFVYVPYIGASKEVRYIGPAATMPKEKKTQAREWADAIIFAVVAATIIRWLLLEAFKIPTPSMERTLLMGDFLFVSKIHYGPRTPQTPLQVPLTHQTWWWSSKSKSYSELIQLPQYRLPGISQVKNDDVVVFNWPEDNDHNPVDLKMNYIKRCVAIAGDTFSIRNKQMFVNGKACKNPPLRQFKYNVYTKEKISRKTLNKYQIPDYANINGNFKVQYRVEQDKYHYFIDLTPEMAKDFVDKGIADSVSITSSVDMDKQAMFPRTKLIMNWTIDDYGPLWIPKKGVTIPMNSTNVEFYGETIEDYEEHKNAEVRDEKLFIDGKEVKEYTFKKDYYFMCGDNRHSSFDSRYWGFVPENYIVGKALFIWFSADPDPKKGFIESIRWSRIFNGIE